MALRIHRRPSSDLLRAPPFPSSAVPSSSDPSQAALDEYDLYLEEDEKANRFNESVELFRIVSSTEFLANSSWILFMNKSDVLREKLPRYPLNKFFHDINEKGTIFFRFSISLPRPPPPSSPRPLLTFSRWCRLRLGRRLPPL